MSNKRIMFTSKTNSLSEFERLAEKTAEMGGTHVYISQIIKSQWQWDMDRTDPYPNWGMNKAAIFKIIVPEPLKKFLPVDYAKGNVDIIMQRAEILKKLGLKAAYAGCDPAWLPESVYEAYPQWRGPRCDHPRRSRRPYYSPCIDNEEVLEMYKGAVGELCKIVPVEHFTFLINDSGGGVCWSRNLYCGPNGPSACEHKPFSQRVVGFLSAIQEGAARAGVEASAGIRAIVLPEDAWSTVPYLKKGQSISDLDNKGEKVTMNVGCEEERYGSSVYPITGIPQVVGFTQEVQASLQNQSKDIIMGIPSVDSDEYFEILKQYENKSSNSVVERYNILKSVAEKFVGEELGEKLVDVWDLLYKGIENMREVGNGGHVLLMGCVSQRWLTRPFVPFPMELMPEEKEYYRKYQFQANTEEEADDMMNIQGQEHINGYSGMWFMTKIMGISINHYKKAVRILNEIIDKMPDKEYKNKLVILKNRINALILIVKNAINAARFQEILDRTDYNAIVHDNTRVWIDQGDPKLREIQKVSRDEIDNTLELIRLLQSTKEPLLVLAAEKDDEDVFTLGPDIIDLLKKKIEIMKKHSLDFNRLYTRFNN